MLKLGLVYAKLIGLLLIPMPVGLKWCSTQNVHKCICTLHYDSTQTSAMSEQHSKKSAALLSQVTTCELQQCNSTLAEIWKTQYNWLANYHTWLKLGLGTEGEEMEELMNNTVKKLEVNILFLE